MTMSSDTRRHWVASLRARGSTYASADFPLHRLAKPVDGFGDDAGFPDVLVERAIYAGDNDFF